MKPRINPLPKNKLGLGIPYLTRDELAAASRIIKSGWLSLGQETEKFEQAIAKYTGAKYAVATNSGTAALHLSVIASGIKTGDEVITTPFTFVASVNCCLYEKAKPVFVDIDPTTLNLDVGQIEAKITSKTKAILGVDVFGYPAEWQPIVKIAKKYNLAIIEDAAEALGAKYQKKKLGSLDRLTVFGFFPNKQMTTGEGGIVTTNNKKQYDLMKHLVNQGHRAGQDQQDYHYLGYNYRMMEIAATLGREQLKKIDWFLESRGQIAGWYDEQLANIPDLNLLKPDDSNHQRSWFVYVILLNKTIDRQQIVAKLTHAGVPVKTYFPSLHLQPYLKSLDYHQGDFPVSEAVSQATLALPFYTGMNQKTVIDVCTELKQALK